MQVATILSHAFLNDIINSWQQKDRSDTVDSSCINTEIGESVPQFEKWQRKQNSIILESKYQLEILTKLYNIENITEIVDFLIINNDLFQILHDAVPQIKKYFKDNFSYLTLKLNHDPEVIGHEELVVYIATKIPLAEARKLYDKFSDNWWLEKFVEVEGSLSINIELI